MRELIGVDVEEADGEKKAFVVEMQRCFMNFRSS